MRRLSRRDIDHAGSAQRVEIGQHAVGHEKEVYDLAGRPFDVRSSFGQVDLAVSGSECQKATRRIPLPTYEYACTACGHKLEAVQSFSDDPLTTCEECGGSLRKVYGNVGIVFKGSGFYKTDSRNGNGKSSSSDSSGTDTATKTDSSATSDSGSSGSDSGSSGSESGSSGDSSSKKDPSPKKDSGGSSGSGGSGKKDSKSTAATTSS